MNQGQCGSLGNSCIEIKTGGCEVVQSDILWSVCGKVQIPEAERSTDAKLFELKISLNGLTVLNAELKLTNSILV